MYASHVCVIPFISVHSHALEESVQTHPRIHSNVLFFMYRRCTQIKSVAVCAIVHCGQLSTVCLTVYTQIMTEM